MNSARQIDAAALSVTRMPTPTHDAMTEDDNWRVRIDRTKAVQQLCVRIATRRDEDYELSRLAGRRDRNARLTTSIDDSIALARRMTEMLLLKDPPYDTSEVDRANNAARLVEEQIFARTKCEASDMSYKIALKRKLDRIRSKIIIERAEAMMNASGSTVAMPEAGKRQGRHGKGVAEYEEGKTLFQGQRIGLQDSMRGHVLKKWLVENSSESQIAMEFLAASPMDRRRIYRERLKDVLDVWLFKQLSKYMEENAKMSKSILFHDTDEVDHVGSTPQEDASDKRHIGDERVPETEAKTKSITDMTTSTLPSRRSRRSVKQKVDKATVARIVCKSRLPKVELEAPAMPLSSTVTIKEAVIEVIRKNPECTTVKLITKTCRSKGLLNCTASVEELGHVIRTMLVKLRDGSDFLVLKDQVADALHHN